MTDAPQGRRLTPSALMQHWDNGVPVVIPISGTPSLRLRIDKSRARVTLRTPLTGTGQLPVNTLAHISVETLAELGVQYVEISTTDSRLVIDGYAMLMAVADRVQLDGAEPLVALEETLKVWQSILSTRVRLSPEAEVGLFGELLLVQALVKTGTSGATAWRGGFGEEHDFGFSDADVEVKTTSGEGRRHWIHGLKQLIRTGETPLWLLSVQITRGGEDQGETLPGLIDDILSIAKSADRTVIESNLAQIGWEDEQRDLFADRWRLRTAPLAFQIDESFPRLTPGLLAEGGIDTSLFGQVNYEIELTARTPSPNPPTLIASIVDHFGEEVTDA